jgi:hypothetical protein
MNEMLPNNTPQETAPETSSIERGAIASGCAAGCAMYLFLGFVSTLLVRTSISPGVAPQINGNLWFWFGVQLVYDITFGAVVGFVTGGRAKHQKMRHALIVGGMIALLLQTPLLIVYLRSGSAGWLPYGFLMTGSKFVIFLPATLYGAYMAQSFERNRGVKIE